MTVRAPWILPISFRSSCEPPRNALARPKPRPCISAIAPHAPRRGCCASTTRSSKPSSRRRSAIPVRLQGSNSIARTLITGKPMTWATVLACVALAWMPAAAMVGGAPPAEEAIARHVVLIVGGNNLCSGVAIAPDLVLTAAHCVLANGRYRLLAVEGRRSVVKDVASVAAHPQFSPRADAPDLALVKLASSPPPNLSPAAFSDRRTPP